MEAEIVKLGTMYFDGDPADPGASFNKKRFSIGDTMPNWELPWVKDGDRLIADRCICVNVSWHQLDCWGFVFGKPITIDGKLYLCRCFKAGQNRGQYTEWDLLMDKFGGDDALWHWNGQYFWGQEATVKDGVNELECAARGYRAACNWKSFDLRVRLNLIGFRPILEPLSPELPNDLVGKYIRVYGPQGDCIKGVLTGLDNYDLTLACEAPVLKNCRWAIQQGMKSIVQRSAIIGVYNTESSA